MWLAVQRPAAPEVEVVCRPSLPALYGAHDARPVLLMLGNSLLFDADWSLPGIASVNCARQGLVARDAAPLVPRLPNMDPAAILLGFGTVEAYRALLTGQPADPVAFEAAMTDLIGGLQARWPEAHVLVSGAPFPGTGGATPILVRQTDLAALNLVLAKVAERAGARFLDTGELPLVRAGRAEAITYDGLHLTDAVYDQWRAMVADALEGTE
jgi:hypothetical protein